MRQQHKTLPFTFDGWDGAGDFGDILYYNVEFTEDFVPFKKGEKYYSVARMDYQGVLEGYIKNDGELNLVHTCKIKYVPVS